MSRVRIERAATLTYIIFLVMAAVLLLAGAVGCKRKRWQEMKAASKTAPVNPSIERQRQEACAFIKQFPDACDELAAPE